VDNLLQEKLTACKLAGIQKNFDRILKEAVDNNMSYLEFFQRLIDEEIVSRENNRYNRLFKRANFPNLKTIDQFNFMKAPFLNKKQILSLVSCEFIKERKNLIFIGSPGTGKSHISVSIGVQACKLGKTVTFFSAAALGNKLVEMQETLQLTKFIDKLKKIDLLIIDELGYIELSHSTTQLMFQIFSERYEKGSIIVSTNLEFREWPKIFKDERMTTAIIDRLIHNSTIVPFNGESYRYKTQREELGSIS
jgi:DNA replication protein DnaC